MVESLDRVAAALLRGVLISVGWLPPNVAVGLGAGIGWLYAKLGGPRVADARINLAIAFPDRNAERREAVLFESFANLGRSFAEVCLMHGDTNGALFDRVAIEGREHLAEGREGSSGALILTAHLGSWEFCAAALAHEGLPVSAVQHGFANPGIGQIVTGWREAAGMETLTMGGAALGMFRALKRGRFVALLMDQNAKRDEGVFAPFFGQPACTRSGPVLLSMSRGTPLIPVFFERVGTGIDHIARIAAPLELEPEGSDPDGALKRNIERVNAAIEEAIRRTPEQWIWSHRRWKTRPPESPAPLYPERRSVLRRLRHRVRR
jgi:KDO2-lipid IV(A) lauroyltransferase